MLRYDLTLTEQTVALWLSYRDLACSQGNMGVGGSAQRMSSAACRKAPDHAPSGQDIATFAGVLNICAVAACLECPRQADTCKLARDQELHDRLRQAHTLRLS